MSTYICFFKVLTFILKLNEPLPLLRVSSTSASRSLSLILFRSLTRSSFLRSFPLVRSFSFFCSLSLLCCCCSSSRCLISSSSVEDSYFRFLSLFWFTLLSLFSLIWFVSLTSFTSLISFWTIDVEVDMQRCLCIKCIGALHLIVDSS